MIRSRVRAGTYSSLLLTAAFLLLAPSAFAAPAWFAPGTLSDTSKDSFNPDVAVDGNGRAISIWTQNGVIAAAFRPNAGTKFGALETVSGAGQAAFQPKVAMDGSGNSVAVWTESPTAIPTIHAATRPVGGGWSAPVTLSDTSQVATDPQIDIDPQGNAEIVFTQSDKIMGVTKPSAGSFGAAQTVSDASQQAYEPDVAAEPNGEAVAVWTRFPGTQQVLYARRRDFTPYSAPIGASPLRASLVPSFKPCEATPPPNSLHGIPLNFGSCNPPVRNSSLVAVGGRSLGSSRIVVCDTSSSAPICAPLVKPDVKLTASITDVRSGSATGPDYNDPDGQPDLTEIAKIRLTDLFSTDGPATATDFDFSVPIDCVVTTDTTIGSSCSANTTMNAIIPGMVKGGKTAVLGVHEVQVFDQGADSIRGNADDKVFEGQGIFLP